MRLLLTVLGLVVAAPSVGRAQTPSEKYPSALTAYWRGHSVEQDFGLGDVAFAFESGGKVIVARRTQEDKDLGRDWRLAEAVWWVQYPEYPRRSPHLLCIQGITRARPATCRDYRIVTRRPRTLMWGDTELTEVAQ